MTARAEPSAAGWLAAGLERRFALAAARTTVQREVLAGLTTFLTMSYILLVNPVILGAAGMDRGAVLVATSLTAALCSVLIGLLAFFLLEKLVLWRHAHGHEQHAHDKDESEHDHAMHR